MILFIKSSVKSLLVIQIESSKREAKEISKLISFQIDNNTATELLIKNVQKSIENANSEIGFISMLDWSGVQVCHPNPKKIGTKTESKDSFVQSVKDELNIDVFYNVLKNSNSNDSEIIYLFSVKNSDWIIGSHVNIVALKKITAQLKQNFLVVYILSSFLIVFLILLIIRFITNYSINKLEHKNEELVFEILKLSKLNNTFSTKDKSIINKQVDKKEIPKNRIITYLRDQIITIETNDIAFVQIENAITTVTNLKGIRHTSNASLEELYKSFDTVQFFRVNRQYIVSINAIDKIYRYGNSQLKITTKPLAKTAIIIGKNKAAAFKKWLNK